MRNPNHVVADPHFLGCPLCAEAHNDQSGTGSLSSPPPYLSIAEVAASRDRAHSTQHPPAIPSGEPPTVQSSHHVHGMTPGLRTVHAERISAQVGMGPWPESHHLWLRGDLRRTADRSTTGADAVDGLETGWTE